ncbi:terpene synthase family protein, partial [Metarhizium majus ARSEF 297]
MQLEMMTLSAFLYPIDHHMEVVIGAQGEKERRAVRDAVNAGLDRHGTLPDSPSLDNETLQRFTNYFWHHPKVQSASTPDKTALLTYLRRYFIAHLDQLDDNDCLQQCCTYPTSSTEPRHASLFQWIQSTSSHHTGGRLAFSFFLCLIGSGKGTDTLPSPQAKYLGEELCSRLAALSRLENDYGSLDRDRAEGNLNSVDFLIRSQQAATNDHVNSINGDKSSATTATNSTLATAKKHLLRLAEYERRSIRRLLYDDLQPLLSPKTFQALKVFATAVDVFGQMYVQKDHTPRRGRSKSTT